MPSFSTPIFLDTQVFEQASYNFKVKSLASLEEQGRKGTVLLVLTDITVREVRARIERQVRSQLEPLRMLKRNSRILRSSVLASVKSVLGFDEQRVIEDLHKQFDEYLVRAKAEVIETAALPAGPVLEKYFAAAPPFGNADKKHEFPDAFVIEATDPSERTLYGTESPRPCGVFPEGIFLVASRSRTRGCNYWYFCWC